MALNLRGRRAMREEISRSLDAHGEANFLPLSICSLDPRGRDEAVAQKGAQNRVKEGVHFGACRSRVSVDASHEAPTLRSRGVGG
jgi:hypothetical protein